MKSPLTILIAFGVILGQGYPVIADEQYPQFRGGDFPAIIEKDGLCLQHLHEAPEGLYPVGRYRCREILCDRINSERRTTLNRITLGMDQAAVLQNKILSAQSSIYADEVLIKNERPASEILARYGRSCGDPQKFEAYYGARWDPMRSK